MNDALEARVKAIFQRVLEIDADARAPFLERVCEGDDALRRRVDDMLSAYDEVGEFLAAPGEDDADGVVPDEGVGAIIDRYKLLQSVGEGGFGTVYMAEQSVPVRRMVALKIIKLGMDTKEVIARFEAERQALAMMDHPNIAKVLDAGATPNGRPYFVMELVRGVSITEYCDQAGVDTPLRLDLFRTVCDAIQHAHQKGVIHRDIKPSNVLVTLHDGVPVPKVIDFGVAKATDHRLTERTLFTELHQMVGTPEYMSPEQAELSGLDVDTRADVYSLGVLLYELLTGTKPFDLKTLLGEGFGAVLRHIREVDPPKPSSRVSTMQQERLITVARQRSSTPATLGKVISGDLDWIVMKALEKDRTRRYETASALAMDILRYQQDEPVLARSPGAGYRLKKYVRRHRVGVGAAAAVIVALVVGAVLAVRGYVEADAQLGRALRAETVARTEAKNAKEQREAAIEAQKQADAAAADAKLQRAEADRRFGIISRLMAAYHEELGDTPRERWSGIFLTGLQAALEEGDPEDVFFFLEQARVDPLLGLIESRDQLTDAALPKALRTVEIAARARVLEAQKDLRRANDTGRLADIRDRHAALNEANDRLKMAILQTRRLARAVAATKPVLPVSLQDVRNALRPNQAYVAFAVLPARVIAFVVTAKTARSVDLGVPAALNEAARRLSFHRDSDPVDAIQDLRSRLIDPLGLEEEVTQVLVSPEGALLAVSFGLLLSDREVAYIPSATAYLSLLERATSAGKDVLAVGDPIYGKQTPRLARLPATKQEAMAIGSIVLLGRDATVSKVKANLPRVTHWRAIHFACHALEDKERPLLSAIAFTPDEHEVGFLRAIDVVQLKFNADLVTLSACETARSEILQGGGIGSLPRAFLYAGAARLLVSQWRVDDAPTVVLMTKFYELWNPRDERKRLGAAAALKAAQMYVRDFEMEKGGKTTKPWAHPYYWAAWTIWGLVD